MIIAKGNRVMNEQELKQELIKLKDIYKKRH